MADNSAGLPASLTPASSLRGNAAIVLFTTVAFAVLFAEPIRLLVRDWVHDPEAGHGLLLAPAAVWLAWRGRPRSAARPQPILGLAILLGAILLRYVSGLAVELFTMRMSVVLGLAGLATYYLGFRQVLAWWLPFCLLALSVPLPEMVKSAMTLPLQFRASRLGAALLEWRGVPVRLSGNIILVPGNQLFVTEACSGLRSLTALVAMAVLLGALFLRTVTARVITVLASVAIAIGINAVRVFLTGFLVVYVDQKLGQGFLHLTEGWLLFLVSLGLIGGTVWLTGLLERRLRRSAPQVAAA